MARVYVAMLLIAVIVFGGGCYGAKLLRQPIAVDETERKLAVLIEQQAKLNSEISELRETISRQEEMMRSLRADTQTRLSELSENVQVVGSRVEDTRSRRDNYYPGGQREPYLPTQPPIGASADTTGARTPLTPSQAKAIYDNAYLDLNRGNYSLALLGFRDYLNKSPDSELADNAQYWIGECHYAQRDFMRAIEELSRVEQAYPLGDKVPAALLKIAYSYLQLEDREAAKSTLRDLINRYPTLEEADQARTKLSTID